MSLLCRLYPHRGRVIEEDSWNENKHFICMLLFEVPEEVELNVVLRLVSIRAFNAMKYIPLLKSQQ